MLGCEVDQSLQIRDCTIDKDALGVVTGRVCGENCIGASGENEDIVGDRFPGGRLYGFIFRVDFDNASIEMVVESTLFEGSVLFRKMSAVPLCTRRKGVCTYPLLGIEI